MKKFLILFFAVFCSFLFAVQKTVTLGKPSDYIILIPEKPGKQELYSANLLAEYIEKIYKTKVSVVKEGTAVKGNVISIGETALAKKNGVWC